MELLRGGSEEALSSVNQLTKGSCEPLLLTYQ